MARKTYLFGMGVDSPSAGDTGVRDFVCDTEADLPQTGFAVGSRAYCVATNTTFRAQAADTWARTHERSAWPVGSIFIAAVNTNPAVLLGYGTWTVFGAGRVLVGQDPADTDFDTGEEIGGAKTRAISAHAGAAVSDHASHTHTYTQVPNHVHVENAQGGTTASTTGTHLMTSAATGGSLRQAATSTQNPTGGVATATTAGPSATLSHSVTQPSAHADINVMQPYIVVWMWKRLA